ncbi:hypothetical protein HNR44_000359 [Geomicrobium halophilum]|uniref:Xaa-Pro dipeptidyl-peptidase C-terminal domain-containing protein n=1 Tax=Geomicrobium halophilum TaxID=549000 RepID=A0A841PHZ2_9BACL|nr:CocE/NonD family hydrolase [Geomicrobium halophilum]MBB6448410.1 hypothetical protein [Geomicrobium halophilum]
MIQVERNVECKCSDGVILRADAYRPNDHQCYPVLLLRLPYDKTNPHYYNGYLDVERMVSAGYVVILQDVRGRFASDGTFYPFVHERKDGYDAVEWAAALPYSNGKVGMFGMSYHGYTQLAAAVEDPPSLYAIAPVMAIADPWTNMIQDPYTPFDQGSIATWALESILPDQLRRENRNTKLKLAHAYIKELPAWLHDQPLTKWKPLRDTDVHSFYFEFVKSQVPKETLQWINVQEKLGNIEIPGLFVGGWFDSLLKQTLEAYERYGGEQMLWIGPWTHSALNGQVGEVFFENDTLGIEQLEDLTELHIRWFDHWLKGQRLNTEKPIHFYHMGHNSWEARRSWPPKNVCTERYYLSSHMGANSRSGNGTLEKKKPETNRSEQLLRNPEDPFPTRGGNLLMAGHMAGILQQGDLQDRRDALVFTSQPLPDPCDVHGRVQASVWVKPHSPLIDLFFQVSDVAPDGSVYNVVDTFIRRKSHASRVPQRVDTVLNDTSYRFEKGHALRLTIAGSNAPRFDVNQNNGTTSRTTTGGKTIADTILHGDHYPSYLSIPIT